MHNDLTDIAGLSVGQAEDKAVRTGVTLVLFDAPAIAAVDVRGGGPGTRESDVLRPGGLVEGVDAIVLSGGSVYGLGAADAVCASLGAQGRGYALMPQPGVPASPIVPAAILYDLANGGAKDWGDSPPYARLGRAALDNAALRAPVRLGRAGAGFGARAGALPGGTGSASARSRDGHTVAALVCVNSFGSVRVPGTQQYWAAPFERDGEFGGLGCASGPVADLEDWGEAKFNPGLRTNTTLAIIATDAALTPDQARRMAIMAQDGMARAIRPVHTPFDGDVVFVASTGRIALSGPEPLCIAGLGSLAADCLARAIARAVHHACMTGV
ncbi:P1 family peptidase [Glycocaulis sp.]|uniref:P1 family peptidase n=1 Tax=Glycocaulis sp. TaxID=1969725 RepID=UPI003D23042E